MKVISLANQKGGVGKTTTALNLGYELMKHGKRVLLIDNDPQANLTRHCGIDPDKTKDDGNYNLTKLYNKFINMIIKSKIQNDDEGFPQKEQVIIRSNGFDLIPSNELLEVAEQALVTTDNSQEIMRAIVWLYGKEYDYVIIDCRPSLDKLTLNALTASDSVIIPIQSEPYALDGLNDLKQNIMRLKEGIYSNGIQVLKPLNPEIHIEGILFTMNNENLRLSKSIDKQINQMLGDEVKIFETRIPKSVKAPEAAKHKKAVAEYKNDNPVAVAYSQLANEILQGELVHEK